MSRTPRLVTFWLTRASLLVMLVCWWQADLIFHPNRAGALPKETIQSKSPLPDSLLKKRSVRILVTDSGLGGVSICAGIDRAARRYASFDTVEMIFCNALAEAGRGYNSMGSNEEKAAVFSAALRGMTDWYDPDAIFIGCNTLSVVYPSTEYARSTQSIVCGIVELGADMFNERMTANPQSILLVLGTETTIEADNHKQILMSMGIENDRIITQACKDLESEIQVDAKSDIVGTLIDFYVGEGVSKIGSQERTLLAGLCCTHYGYSIDQFAASLKNAWKGDVEILNPNSRMEELLFPQEYRHRSGHPTVTAQVVSRAVLSESEIVSIAQLLQEESPAVASALRSYVLKPDLFTTDGK